MSRNEATYEAAWQPMRHKETGLVAEMIYVSDACDGGTWFMRGSRTPIHTDAIYHEWEELNGQ
jgi:hypothetical protein